MAYDLLPINGAGTNAVLGGTASEGQLYSVRRGDVLGVVGV